VHGSSFHITVDSNTAKPLQGYFEATDIAPGELLVLSEPERIECYIALAVNRSGTCVAIRLSDGAFLDTLSNRNCGLVYKRWQLYLETEKGDVLVREYSNESVSQI
jgi:hypothetical protein